MCRPSLRRRGTGPLRRCVFARALTDWLARMRSPAERSRPGGATAADTTDAVVDRDAPTPRRCLAARRWWRQRTGQAPVLPIEPYFDALRRSATEQRDAQRPPEAEDGERDRDEESAASAGALSAR